MKTTRIIKTNMEAAVGQKCITIVKGQLCYGCYEEKGSNVVEEVCPGLHRSRFSQMSCKCVLGQSLDLSGTCLSFQLDT